MPRRSRKPPTAIAPSAFSLGVLLSQNSAVDRVLGSGNAGAQGGAFSYQAKGKEHTWLSAITDTIDATRFTGELVAGPIDTPLCQDGFVSLAFSVQVDGTTAKTQIFATAGVANAYCGDQVLNFGLVSPVANLEVNFTLELTSTTEGDGYGVPYLLGTTNGNLPPVNEVPGLQNRLAGELRAVAGVSIDDPDAEPAEIFTTTLVITGTLAGLSIQSSAGGIDTVTIETKDASSDTDTFPVNTAALPARSIAADAPSIRPEGDSGSALFTFTVIRSGDLSLASKADFAVSGADAADFVGGVLSTGSVSFAAIKATAVITTAVAGDTTVELDETFSVQLSTPAGDKARLNEGNSGTTPVHLHRHPDHAGVVFLGLRSDAAFSCLRISVNSFDQNASAVAFASLAETVYGVLPSRSASRPRARRRWR